MYVLDTLQKGNEFVIILPVKSYILSDESINLAEDIMEKVTGINWYFHKTSKAPRTSKVAIWNTSQIKVVGYFNYPITFKLFDIKYEHIKVSKQIMDLFVIDAPLYSLFIGKKS